MTQPTPPPSFTDSKADTATAVQILEAALSEWNQSKARLIISSAKKHRITLRDLEQAATQAIEEKQYVTWHDILTRTNAYNRPIKWNANQQPHPNER